MKFLYSKGFRIFFLGASLFSIGSIAIWALRFGEPNLLSANINPNWHGHEMIFGFSTGIIAAFVLTAGENWTKHKIISNTNLAMLFNIWTLGRAVNITKNSIPKITLIIIDLSFMPVLIITILHSIIRHKKSNIVILLITTVLLILNFCSYFHKYFNKYNIYYTSIIIIILLILRILSQLLPSYGQFQIHSEIRVYKNINRVITLLIGIFIIINLFNQNLKIFPASLLFCIAVSNIYRAAGWNVRNSLKEPMLFVLFVGYYWIQIGFLLNSFSLLFNYNIKIIALHILTIGGIGTITLSMMTRVSLGHSNQKISACNHIIISFIFITISVIIRTILTLLFSEKINLFIIISSVFWIISFAIFTVKHIALLSKSKINTTLR